MKAFKNITLVLLAALLVPSLALLLSGITLGTTVFSPSYFNSVFDRSFTNESVEALASGASSGSGATAEAMGALLKSKEGSSWFKNELPKTFKGSYRYFASGSGELPVVNIKTLKDWLINTYINQATSGDGTGLMRQLVKSELGINSMKDKLDLNALAKNAYGGAENPVAGIGPMLLGVRTNLFWIILSVTLILMALIAVIAFQPTDILRWLGVPLVISGALCFLAPLISFVFNGALKAGIAQSFGLGADMAFVTGWILSFVNGIALVLLIAGAVSLAAGIALLAFSKHAGRGGNPHVGVRVAAGLVLAAALPLALFVFGKATWTSVEKYDSVLQTSKGISIGRALDKTLNCKLFSQVMK